MTIIAAIDFSPASLQAAHSALDIAQRFGDTLHLIHVQEPPAFSYPEFAAGIDSLCTTLKDAAKTQIQEVQQVLQKRLQKQQKQESRHQAELSNGPSHSNRRNPTGAKPIEALEVNTDVLFGNPSRVLAEQAENLGARMIVMGSRRRRRGRAVAFW